MFSNELNLDFYTNSRGEKWYMGRIRIRYNKKTTWGGEGSHATESRSEIKQSFFEYIRHYKKTKKSWGYTSFVITIKDEDNNREWTINDMKEVGRFREIYRQLSQRRGWSPNAELFTRQNAKKRRK